MDTGQSYRINLENTCVVDGRTYTAAEQLTEAGYEVARRSQDDEAPVRALIQKDTSPADSAEDYTMAAYIAATPQQAPADTEAEHAAWAAQLRDALQAAGYPADQVRYDDVDDTIAVREHPVDRAYSSDILDLSPPAADGADDTAVDQAVWYEPETSGPGSTPDGRIAATEQDALSPLATDASLFDYLGTQLSPTPIDVKQFLSAEQPEQA